MTTFSRDIRPDIEGVQIELFREAGPATRFALARSLSETIAQLSRSGLRRKYPEASEAEVRILILSLHYGLLPAGGRKQPLMEDTLIQPHDVLAALLPVTRALEELGIPYYIGGSVASSYHGVPRSTLDVDVVANVSDTLVQHLVARLAYAYYVDADMILEALQHGTSFNVIYLPTMTKIDIYKPGTRPYDREAAGRVQESTIEDQDGSETLLLLSPEDAVLTKLEWYKLGGGVSERQWTDVLGVLKVQGAALDVLYMRRWAAELGIDDLLERAFVDTE